ncbi:MAG: hypothetical protein R2712_03265 [Vicinamibacterales bacterium]
MQMACASRLHDAHGALDEAIRGIAGNGRRAAEGGVRRHDREVDALDRVPVEAGRGRRPQTVHGERAAADGPRATKARGIPTTSGWQKRRTCGFASAFMTIRTDAGGIAVVIAMVGSVTWSAPARPAHLRTG